MLPCFMQPLEAHVYYHGFAGFALKDRPAAAKSLDRLAPFADPVFGTHARYLRASWRPSLRRRNLALRTFAWMNGATSRL